MKYKRTLTTLALASLLIFNHASAIELQTQESPLTIYGIDFENVNNLPACLENDANSDLNHYESENALVLEPEPVACITPHVTCKVGEWSPMALAFSIEQSKRIQGRVQTPRGVRAIYAMHANPGNTGQGIRFEIGVKDIPEADIRIYLNEKYRKANEHQANQNAIDVIDALRKKLRPDSFQFWLVEHQSQSYLIYYARVSERQIIGSVTLK